MEVRPVRKDSELALQRAEMRKIRWMCGQEVDQRKLGESFVEKDCQAHNMNREDAMDCNRWRNRGSR